MAVKNETKEYFLKGWKKENLDSRETAQGIFLDMIYPVSEKHFFKSASRSHNNYCNYWLTVTPLP